MNVIEERKPIVSKEQLEKYKEKVWSFHKILE